MEYEQLYPIDTLVPTQDMFNEVCEKGCIDDAKNIYCSNTHDVIQPLKAACEQGHFDIVVWLFSLIQTMETMSNIILEIFNIACYNGQYKLAKWIYNNGCSHGHNHIISLYEYGKTLKYCIASQNIDLIKWVLSLKNVIINNQMNDNYSNEEVIVRNIINVSIMNCFTRACLTGNIRVMKILYSDAFAVILSSSLLDTIIRKLYNTHTNVRQVATWLFKINPTMDLRENDDALFRLSCKHNNISLAKWLKSMYPREYTFTFKKSENVITDYYILNSLPVKDGSVRTITHAIDIECRDEACLICRENTPNVITSCSHLYCYNCIDRWYSKQKTCPYCRVTINEVYKL
jgi:Zinc finger, C3HC4 type (RING finger)